MVSAGGALATVQSAAMGGAGVAAVQGTGAAIGAAAAGGTALALKNKEEQKSDKKKQH